MSTTGRELPSLETLLEPIHENAPGGESLRYTPEWDAIVEARSAEIDLPRGEWKRQDKRSDWPLVERLCSEALITKTKDLQIAVWLAEAWIHLYGLDGLITGTRLLAGLHERFQLTMYPTERPGEPLTQDSIEHRTNLIRAFNTRMALEVRFVPISAPTDLNLPRYSLADLDQKKFEDLVQRRENPERPREENPLLAFELADAATSQVMFASLSMQVQTTLGEIRKLDALLDEVYGQQNSGLNALKEELGRIAQHLIPRIQNVQEFATNDLSDEYVAKNLSNQEQIVAEFEYDGVANPQVAWNSPQEEALTGPAIEHGPRRGPANRTEAYEMIRLAADYLRRTEPHSPVPYLLRRAVRWGSLSLQELLPELLQHPEQFNEYTLHSSGMQSDDPFRD